MDRKYERHDSNEEVADIEDLKRLAEIKRYDEGVHRGDFDDFVDENPDYEDFMHSCLTCGQKVMFIRLVDIMYEIDDKRSYFYYSEVGNILGKASHQLRVIVKAIDEKPLKLDRFLSYQHQEKKSDDSNKIIKEESTLEYKYIGNISTTARCNGKISFNGLDKEKALCMFTGRHYMSALLEDVESVCDEKFPEIAVLYNMEAGDNCCFKSKWGDKQCYFLETDKQTHIWVKKDKN